MRRVLDRFKERGTLDEMGLGSLRDAFSDAFPARLPMYASAGIAEVWLVDVAGAAIEVHTQPTADGYAHTERFAGAQHLPIAALAG